MNSTLAGALEVLEHSRNGGGITPPVPLTGKRIKSLREHLKLSQDVFASKNGLSLADLQRWEENPDSEIT